MGWSGINAAAGLVPLYAVKHTRRGAALPVEPCMYLYLALVWFFFRRHPPNIVFRAARQEMPRAGVQRRVRTPVPSLGACRARASSLNQQLITAKWGFQKVFILRACQPGGLARSASQPGHSLPLYLIPRLHEPAQSSVCHGCRGKGSEKD